MSSFDIDVLYVEPFATGRLIFGRNKAEGLPDWKIYGGLLFSSFTVL